VCNMAVDERFRRRGYGSALLAAAEAVARLGGQADVYLQIRARDAPARRLYEGAGYHEVGARGLAPGACRLAAPACEYAVCWGWGRRGRRGGDRVGLTQLERASAAEQEVSRWAPVSFSAPNA